MSLPKNARVQLISRYRALIVLILIMAYFLAAIYLLTHDILSTIILFVTVVLIPMIGALTFSQMSVKIAQRLGEKIRRASSEELIREDDVLLQAVAFSQSVFFIYLNLIPESGAITTLKILVPIFAVLFYTLRAWGKISENSKYRYWSIWVFFLIVTMTLFFFALKLSASILGYEIMAIYVYSLGGMFASICLGLMRFIDEVSKKRYGLRREF